MQVVLQQRMSLTSVTLYNSFYFCAGLHIVTGWQSGKIGPTWKQLCVSFTPVYSWQKCIAIGGVFVEKLFFSREISLSDTITVLSVDIVISEELNKRHYFHMFKAGRRHWFFWLSLSFSLSLSLSLSLSYTHTHTHTHSFSLSFSLTHAHILSLSFSLSLSINQFLSTFVLGWSFRRCLEMMNKFFFLVGQHWYVHVLESISECRLWIHLYFISIAQHILFAFLL